jgi:O-antigen/teichoic acid export membrane protein
MRFPKDSPSRNLITAYFSFASISFYGLASIPLATRFLSQDEIGLWNLVSQLTAYLALLDLGLGTACARLLAGSLIDGAEASIQKTWSTLVMLMAAFSIAMAIIGASCIHGFPSWFKLPEKLATEARWLVFGMILIQAGSFINRAWSGVLTAQDRFHWVLLISGCVPWIQFGMFGLLLVHGSGIKSYMIAAAIAAFIQGIWLHRLVCRGPNRLVFSASSFTTQEARSMLSYSLPMLAWSSAPALFASIPAWIIGRYSGTEMLAAYMVTYRFPQMASMLAMRGFHAYYPRIQNQHLSADKIRFTTNFRFSATLSMLLSIALLVSALLWNREFVSLLAREHFYAGIVVTFWICIGFLISGIADHLGTLLVISGKPGRITLVLIVEFVLTALLAIGAHRRYGIEGAAAASAICPLLLRIPYLYSVASRSGSFSCKNFYGLPASIALLATICLMIAFLFESCSSTSIKLTVAAAAVLGSAYFIHRLRNMEKFSLL